VQVAPESCCPAGQLYVTLAAVELDVTQLVPESVPAEQV
jgi:hypothetical protein